MLLQRLNKNDLPEIIAFNRRCFSPGDRWSGEDWTELLEDERAHYYALLENGQIVGNMFLYDWQGERDFLKIMNLGVAPDRRGQGLACRLLERYDKLLSTILIGNNIVNIAMASLATALFVKSFGDAGATLSTIVVTVVVLIFGEISPKSIAKDCAENWAMTAAPFLRCLIWLLMPLNALFSLWKKLLARMFHLDGDNKMSPEELLMLVNEVQQDGSIDKDEGDLLKNAIGFSEQEAQDILIHRVDLAALPVDATKEEVADLFTQTKYSRLLIYREDIDHIIGTIHQKDFYVGCGVTDKPLEEILSPVMFVLENEPISLLLKKLQLAKTQMAVVVDEYGGTEGLLTMEDILEELVGEIWDEHDEVTEDFRKQSDGSWLVAGSASVDDLYEELDLPEEEDIDSNTVNGLVQEKTCHLPKVGDRFTLGEYDGVVTRTAKRRVTEVRLTPAAPAEDAEKDDEKEKRFSRIAQRGESR